VEQVRFKSGMEKTAGTTAGAADSKISNRPVTFDSNLEASQIPTLHSTKTVESLHKCKLTLSLFQYFIIYYRHVLFDT